MSVKFEEKVALRRRALPLESLRMLVNRAIGARRECLGIHVRRIIVTEPDASGCNWQAEWPLFRPANSEPCRSRLRELVEELRLRYNVER
jgi:hypothetical protein